MKKIFLFFIITLTVSMICSCNHGHSKAYVALEKEMNYVETQINELDNCDDLQMLSFSILGLRSDLENARQNLSVSEAEAAELEKMTDHLEAVWQTKVDTLNCTSNVEDDEELVTSDEDDYGLF